MSNLINFTSPTIKEKQNVSSTHRDYAEFQFTSNIFSHFVYRDIIDKYNPGHDSMTAQIAEDFFFYVEKPSLIFYSRAFVHLCYVLQFVFLIVLNLSLFILIMKPLGLNILNYKMLYGFQYVMVFYLTCLLFLTLMSSRVVLASIVHTTLYVYTTFMFSPFFSFNLWSILLGLPPYILLLLVLLRRETRSLEQYFLYVKVVLINFFGAYGFYLTMVFILFRESQKFAKLNQLNPVIKFYDLTYFENYLMIKEYKVFSQNFLFKLIFVIDDLGLIFIWLSYLLVSLCVYFLWNTMRADKNFILYISQLILLLLQLQLTFTAIDIFTFFLAFESLLIPMIIMIALWGSKNNRQANNYLILYTMVSAIPMLLSILYLKAYGFDTIIFNLQESLGQLSMEEKMVIWCSFFFAFAVKTPMVPVHIWLPKTHVDAPTVGSVILAGVLLKVGLIGILRFLFPLFPVLSHFYAPYVTAVATIGVIYASLITLRQIDAKRIIAYSSVAHMNMAMVSLFSFNIVGLYSTVYLMVSHGLIASGLFFLVGFLYNRFHVRSIYYYSGLATCMPVCSIYFFLFTLANMAFPLTSGFIGEFLLLLGITLNNFYLGVLNSLSMLLTTVYSVLLFGRIFLGELKPWLEHMALNYIRFTQYKEGNNLVSPLEEEQLDLYFHERFILNVLFFYIVVLGLCPQYLFNYFFSFGSFFYLLLPIL